ncbi:hypothetical protein G8O24_37435 [Bradyrhizobium sp. INPA01-394B]|jgi:hypothetical protein|uniref:DUF2188 domain-containing protein n=1 Tax=Bradyrhizobium campsiandrae TaxID=1729892 RepID=A0ABR7U4V7_9BRAD|nr:hypothetical protein [Bradyrhizobium campsiandrae]MBC9882984.1 hypothetical protein [Bradyrhizobium campsiandrae]MBC9979015.1 hypothetical protein [Bradyrhizobium campsiandrae]
MSQISGDVSEYRGYTLSLVRHASGWRVQIYPGGQLLRTDPDSVSAVGREEALARARAVIDHHLST